MKLSIPCCNKPKNANNHAKDVFSDEHGFTTTSMVLSLLIALALVFTGAQVYRINSAAAEVQDIADAAAMAAENQVANFMTIARFCDATILTLSLTGLTACALGIAALCTPVTAAASKTLIKAGKEILEARNKFADKAASVLNKLQEALPFFATASAAAVASANNVDSHGSRYIAVAILAPAKGERIDVSLGDKAESLMDEVERDADDIREKAKRAEEAAQRANRSKERAFMRDCGDNPSYCMYERADHLVGLAGSRNPLYSSIDTWTFAVALNRAKAYYRARLNAEGPANGSLAEQARSALRARFYRYALKETRRGYVHETEDSFEAYFPHLPNNTSEMRHTSLYTDSVYPITENESGSLTMHAWPGCPEAVATLARGSIAQMESGGFETCATCSFTAASMGKVAAASTSIPNGFEYHYEAVADEALIYEKARHDADVPKSQVKSAVSGLFEKLVEAAKEAAGKRIKPEPPGRFGAVAFVVNIGLTPAAGPFASGFVSSSGSLGPRAAVSAATLVDEGSDEGKTALNSMLDNLKGEGVVAGAASIVLDAWSFLLKAYSDGQNALTRGIEEGLGSLPLIGESGLGSWVSDKLSEVIETVGLQPAEITSLKPVLVNSAHVALADESALSNRLVSAKQLAITHPLMSTDLFSSILSDAERTAIERIESIDDTIEIASIELFGGSGPSIPVTIPVPQPVKNLGVETVQSLIDRIKSIYVETTGVRVWE